jgi:F-type H+-transporting ATPase subunit b
VDILDIKWPLLLIQTGGFVLLLIVLKLFLFRPILGILDARKKEVTDTYDAAEEAKRASEQARQDYEKRLADVAEEIRAIKAAEIKEAQRIKDEIVTESREQADKILEKAREEIGREKDSAMVELRKTAVDLAIGAAGKLIKANLDEPKQRQLVSQAIDDLDQVNR